MSTPIVGLPPGATLQPISPAPQQAIAGLPPGATVRPIGPVTSPSGGQAPAASQTPGAVSRYLTSAGAPSTTVSDYWKGPGEAILHPELEWESLKNMWQGAGQAQQNLTDRAYEEQRSPGWKNKVAGIGHGMEAAIPFVGPAMAKAGDQFSSGDIAGALGSLTQVALAAKGAEKTLPEDIAIPEASIPKKAGFVSTAVTKTLGRKAKVEPVIENSLQNFRDDTAKTLSDATKLTRGTIGKTANSLVEADKAVYGDKGNISVAPIHESIEAARQVHTSLAEEKMPLPDKVTAALDQPKGANISFDDAQKLRTYLGTAVKDAPSHLQGVIKQGYSALSDALSQQASDLDAKLGANGKLSATWENFNKRYGEFAESANGVLRNLNQAKSGADFSRLLGDKNFRALINRAMMQMHEAGMSPQLLDQWAKISAPLQKAIGGKGGFGGMVGTLYESPIVATGAYEAAPSALGWIPRMVGIVKMAEAIRRVKAMQTVLDNGLDPSIRYTPPIEGGATIGEQLAAKGQMLPKVSGTENVMSARRAEMQTSASKLGPEFAEGERQHLITQYKKVLQNSGATAEEKSIATSQLADLTESEQNPAPSMGRGSAPQVAYRARPVGETEIPASDRPQATVSPEEAETYRQSLEDHTGKPHEVVPIDLTKVDHEIVKGPNGKDWVHIKPQEAGATGGAKSGTVNVEGEEYQIQPDGSLEPLEAVNRQNRVRETVDVSKKIEKGERELERLKKMKAHIGPARYEEAVAEISKMLDTLRAQVEH